MSQFIRALAGLAFGLATAANALAAPITPSFTRFGELSGATFGGSGIPNNRVAIYEDSDPDNLTLGLTATPRFVGSVGDNGAGVFAAQAGVSTFGPSPADPHAVWNFNFYIAGSTMQNLTFILLYDFDPAAATEAAAHGSVVLPGDRIPDPAQSSWNLGMNFLAAAVPGLTPPAFAAFNPNAAGEYSFALVALSAFGDEVGRVAIQVNVSNAVPEPGALALAGLALLGVAASRRRRT